MLRSDALQPNFQVDYLFSNIDSITLEVIDLIENELDPYDLISLVFLLYDGPDTALQRLIMYQRVSKGNGENNMNLLCDWAQCAQSQPTWKSEFLEALAICQLYGIIRKLGINPQNVQKHYFPNNFHTSFFINPMKKALYRLLCENITAENLKKLQHSLKTYGIDTYEYQSCEIIILDLICKKFINLTSGNHEKLNNKCHIDKLTKIIQNFPGLQQFANELIELQNSLNTERKTLQASMDNNEKSNINPHDDPENCEGGKCPPTDVGDIFEQFNQMCLEELNIQNLKSDTKRFIEGAYPIKNPERVGVCYIINQEDFHPSKQSIESSSQAHPLEKRQGSNMDKKDLQNTMATLNFEVISNDNIDHQQMLQGIKDTVKYRVQPDHSMFMLVILSHGVTGYVFAADSVKVKINDIKNLLDEGFHQRNLEIPKVMILQACRVDSDTPMQMKLIADSPSKHMKKLDFLICWATAPELEAYRNEKLGSIFIRILCHLIRKHAKQEHLGDILIKVTDRVAKLCTRLNKDQIPSTESTLTKKLYLQFPE